MKVTDTRDGTVMQGQLIATLPANQEVTARDMRAFYKVPPDSRTYDIMARPCEYDRLVLQRGDDQDNSFYIVPKYPFYEVTEDDTPQSEVV